MASLRHDQHHFLGGAAGLATLITTFGYGVFASYQTLTDTRTSITNSKPFSSPSHLPRPTLSTLPADSLLPATADYGFCYPINGTGVTWSECFVPANYYAYTPQHMAPLPDWLAHSFLLLLYFLGICCLPAMVRLVDALQARFEFSCRPRLPRSVLCIFDFISNAYASYTQTIALASLGTDLLSPYTTLPWWTTLACLVLGIVRATWCAMQARPRASDEEIMTLKDSQSSELKAAQTRLSEKDEEIAALKSSQSSELEAARARLRKTKQDSTALISSLSSELEAAQARLRQNDEEITALKVSLSTGLEPAKTPLREKVEEMVAAPQVSMYGAQADLETVSTVVKSPSGDLQEAQHAWDPSPHSHLHEGDEGTISGFSSTGPQESDEKLPNNVEDTATTVPCADTSNSPAEETEGLRTISSNAKAPSSRIPRSVAKEPSENRASVVAKSPVEERTTKATKPEPPFSDKTRLEPDSPIPKTIDVLKRIQPQAQRPLASNLPRLTEQTPMKLGINCYWRGTKDGTSEMFPCTNIAKGTCIGDPSRYQGNGELKMTRNADGSKEDLFRGRREKGDKNKQDAKKAKVCVDCWNRSVDDGTAYLKAARG